MKERELDIAMTLPAAMPRLSGSWLKGRAPSLDTKVAPGAALGSVAENNPVAKGSGFRSDYLFTAS